MVALGHQLYTLGITGSQELDFEDPLAYDVMNIYQAMGDAIAKQYSGSPAHQKVRLKLFYTISSITCIDITISSLYEIHSF